jgi:acetyl esterase/lipase
LYGFERLQSMTQFAYGPDARHALDLYSPRRASDATVIIFFYGGRWQSGLKSLYRPLALSLRSRGYVVAVPDYRLYPKVRFPAFLEDAALAARWTQDNIACFGGDPHSIFVMGHSAGAYIAAMLALDPQWLGNVGIKGDKNIAGFIGLAGPYDFLPLEDPILIDIFGGAHEPATQPITFAHPGSPPSLLLTGGGDRVVHPRNSIGLADRLRRSGNVTWAIKYPSLGHISILAPFVPGLAGWFSAGADVARFCQKIREDRALRVPSADEVRR